MSNYLTKEELKLLEEIKSDREKKRQASEIIHYLGFTNIAYAGQEPTVPAQELIEVLFDEEKRQKLISLVKMKAFW